jgi:hypothetical protein
MINKHISRSLILLVLLPFLNACVAGGYLNPNADPPAAQGAAVAEAARDEPGSVAAADDPDREEALDSQGPEAAMESLEFEEAQESYEKQLQSQIKAIDEKVRSDIRELAIQFPKVWNDKSVPDREKKRMLRCLVEDVTISQGQDIMLSIRFKGGTSRIVNVTKPEKWCEKWTTHPEVMAEIDRLTAEHTTSEIVEILSKRGIKSGQGKNFTNRIIDRLIREHDIKNLYTRLREDGYLTLPEKMIEMGCSQKEIQKLRETDKINSRKYCDRDEFLYEPCK